MPCCWSFLQTRESERKSPYNVKNPGPEYPALAQPLEGDILLLSVLNPKFEYRNPKQIRNSNYKLLKTIK